MHAFRRLFAASAAVIVAMTSGVLVAHGDTTPPVYNTPGGQISQGRLWNTTCEKYSSNVVRCSADIWASTVTYVNGRYVKKTGWVFNNVVLFSSPSIPAVTKVPAWIIDQSRLSFTGLGPLQVGTSMKDLTTLGYFTYPGPACGSYEENKYLVARGVDASTTDDRFLTDVFVYKNGLKTIDGAHVGMTLGQLKSIYGARLNLVKKEDESSDGRVPLATVQSDGNELVFRFESSVDTAQALKDSDVIDEMVAREISPYFSYDGC